ncbi:MAG: F-type H+-transporting ATPase subunit gamma [Oceanicoccus sp.]|jgi:F-type H+-transporting ATPase subunit gamma
MSGNLLEIKKKIGGVKNTRKITKAMQLVAVSKMQRFQIRAVASRSFVWDLLNVLDRNMSVQSNSPYSEKRTEGKTLFVVYTSDKGLCGSLNTKLNNALYRSDKWKNTPEDERLLITIGKKAHDYAKSNKIDVVEHFLGIPEKLATLDAIQIIDRILSYWTSKEAKEVIFIAPHYKNSFTFYPVMKTFLPFTEDTIESVLGHLEEGEKPEFVRDENQFMIFAPSEDHVLDRLYEQIIQAMFIQSFLELKASEYSSRMIAMQNATDAADRMIKDLTRVYNQIRQSKITQEIAELMGASMAMEDED